MRQISFLLIFLLMPGLSIAAPVYSDTQVTTAVELIIRDKLGVGPDVAIGSGDAFQEANYRLEDYKTLYSNPTVIKQKCDYNPDSTITYDFEGYIEIPRDCDLLDDNFRTTFSYQQALARSLYAKSKYSFSINSILRSHDNITQQAISPIVNLMIAAYSSYPEFQGEAYRGIRRLPADVLATYKIGKTVTDKTFVSASLDKEHAESFFDRAEGWFLIIKSHTCRNISAFNPAEKEILCFPGSRFSVTKRDDLARTIWVEQIP